MRSMRSDNGSVGKDWRYIGSYKVPAVWVAFAQFCKQSVESIPPPPMNFLVLSACTNLSDPLMPRLVMQDVMQASYLLVPP